MKNLKQLAGWIVAGGVVWAAAGAWAQAAENKPKPAAPKPPQDKTVLPQLSADDLAKIEAALPAQAAAKPQRARRILVFWRCEGFFHGGVIGGVAEAVMGAAAATLAPAGHDVVGASYTLNLMAPALGPLLVARGAVVKPGRRLIVCRADVSVELDGATRLCAIAQGTMALVKGA